jgi:hypothetical protein
MMLFDRYYKDFHVSVTVMQRDLFISLLYKCLRDLFAVLYNLSMMSIIQDKKNV